MTNANQPTRETTMTNVHHDSLFIPTTHPPLQRLTTLPLPLHPSEAILAHVDSCVVCRVRASTPNETETRYHRQS